MTGWDNTSVLVKSLGDRLDHRSTLTCPLKVVRVMLWSRAGTWGIASSQEPTSGGAASCLMATADPAVVPALLIV
ncbi:hypothetical protein [Sporosarcina ureae]|uniref:hypothetical protein n=1 Tax=Sporosarcina ureae TaxID=1571 RepID=UPI0012F51A10|nr:hypothetical protein [Sporosarcina ureae]